MRQVFAGFCGESYQFANKYAAIERLVNFYCDVNEQPDQETKFKLALSPTPGNRQFSQLPVGAPFNQPNRGLIEVRGTVIGVNGTIAFSLSNIGVFTNLGIVANDGNPVSMAANGNGQVFIASAGQGYVVPANGGIGSLIAIPNDGSAFLGSTYATFQDGYIIVVNPPGGINGTPPNQFQISGTDDSPVGDATKWQADNITQLTGQADVLRACISTREYLRLLGARRTQIFVNLGTQGIGAFPFQSYNETFIETGIAAPFSLVNLGESLMWIGEDERGQRAAWRDQAFQPQRVSNFAVEQFWQKYPTVSDARAFAYIWNGHLFYRITFPTANATWQYDATTSQLVGRPMWSECQFLNSQANLVCRPEQFHCYAYGLHLVGSAGGDGNPGAVYSMDLNTYSDCGTDNDGNQS